MHTVSYSEGPLLRHLQLMEVASRDTFYVCPFAPRRRLLAAILLLCLYFWPQSPFGPVQKGVRSDLVLHVLPPASKWPRYGNRQSCYRQAAPAPARTPSLLSSSVVVCARSASLDRKSKPDPQKLSGSCRLVLPDRGNNLTLPQVPALWRNRRPILSCAGTLGRR